MSRAVIVWCIGSHVILTRRAGVYRIELLPMRRKILQRVRLDKLIAAIVRLWLNIHTYNIKTRALVALRCAASTTEEVKQSHDCTFALPAGF